MRDFKLEGFKTLKSKIIYWLVFLAMIFFLLPGQEAGAINPLSEEIPGSSNNRKVEISAIPETTLDPHFSFNQGHQHVWEHIYSFLYIYDRKTHSLSPQLARDNPKLKVCEENGERSYIIEIRDDKKFHSGRKVTVNDIKYSLMRSLLHDTPGGSSGFLWQRLFAVNSLREFIADVSKLDDVCPASLSPGEAGKIYGKILERIRVVDDSLVLQPKNEPDDKERAKKSLQAVLSSAFPGSAIVDKKKVEKLGGWSGDKSNWTFYYKKMPGSSVLSNNFEAGAGNYEMISWRPGETLVLKESEPGKYYWQVKGELKVIRSNISEVALKRLLQENYFARVEKSRPVEEKFLRAAEEGGYDLDEVTGDSSIYLMSGRNLKEIENSQGAKSICKISHEPLNLKYYRENNYHNELAERIMHKGQEICGITISPQGIEWENFQKRIYSGDFTLALIEWLQPFHEILGDLYLKERFLPDDVKLQKVIARPERYIFSQNCSF